MSQEKKVEAEEKGCGPEKRGIAVGLRKCNIWMLILSVMILMLLCVLLLMRIGGLNETIERLTAQAEGMSRVIEEQRSQLAQMELLEQKVEELLAMEEAKNNPPKRDDGQGEQEDQEPESTAAHKVYLTFDDGPSIYTQDILDILDEYGVKATFFVVGKENDAAKESMRRIVEEGHTLAMHSYSHKYSDIYASVENFAEDFAKIQNYIYDVTGVKSTIYRFPGGSSNSVSPVEMEIFAKYLDEQDIHFFDWNISSGDGGSYVFPVETLLENCTSNVSRFDTSVILMHDSAGKKTTIEALPSIIETILDMEDTEILPITEKTDLVQHIKWQDEEDETEE